MTTAIYIPPEIADKIKETAQLEEVVADFIQLKPSGASQVGDCPSCGGKKKLSVTPSKGLWKCFKCDLGGKDAISFLQKMQGKTYPEALHLLADRYHIDLNGHAEPKKNILKTIDIKGKFRDIQLRESGIDDKDQKYWLSGDKDTRFEKDRYEAASMDRAGNVIPGNDMVLHYLDLEGAPLMFRNEKGKLCNFIRVRWANPALHLVRGKPTKYASIKGSGNQLWIPNAIIEAFAKFSKIETLYIIEGEKKADKMCKHGMMAVALSGIFNLSTGGEMPYLFQQLIKRCEVKRVVFVVDADWQDLSLSDPTQPVDSRPSNFYKAALRFRDYFYAYHYGEQPIDLDIYLAHGKSQAHKGMDDLLVFSLRGEEHLLADDFNQAMFSQTGEGEHVNAHNITQMSSYKLKEFWHLHSRPAFFEHHKEELKPLREFRYGVTTWRWNEAGQEFEMADKIRPHEQYWHKIYDGEDKNGRDKWKFSFNYVNIFEFLKNRGYGLFEVDDETFRFVKTEGKVVEETTSYKLQRYVIDFTRELDEPPVLEMMLRGGKQYLGPDKLGNMHGLQFEWNRSDHDTMFLYFRNTYWKITANDITEHPLADLPRHIWKEKVVDFDAKYLGEPLMTVEREKDDWKTKPSEAGGNCDMANFYLRTSMFHWRKNFELKTDSDGNQSYELREEPEPASKDEMRLWRANMVAKMVATGYLLHDYTDWGLMKAIVCMDGLESEVGKSQGGSGKGVYCTQFEKMVPVHWVNGKRKNLEEDKHLYAGVDERTQVIYFEDIRVNFDFEQLFPGITRGTWVEKKGVDGHKEEPKKHLLDTNHGLTGEGNSFWRRQFLLSFSDYYNKHRRVSDDFGYQLYEEWDDSQWNLFYNWMATCCQAFLQHRLTYSIPQDALERRNLRQRIGENFLDWATLMFDPETGLLLNCKIEKVWATEHYLITYPQDRRYVSVKKFKTKLQQYAQYAGLEFNPGTSEKDNRIKSNGKEYFILADDKFDPNNCNVVAGAEDLARLENPCPI